jgi:hypothetical protein
MSQQTAMVEIALSNAIVLGLNIKDWEDKCFVQLDTRNPKALKSALAFLLGRVCPDVQQVGSTNHTLGSSLLFESLTKLVLACLLAF